MTCFVWWNIIETIHVYNITAWNSAVAKALLTLRDGCFLVPVFSLRLIDPQIAINLTVIAGSAAENHDAVVERRGRMVHSRRRAGLLLFPGFAFEIYL